MQKSTAPFLGNVETSIDLATLNQNLVARSTASFFSGGIVQDLVSETLPKPLYLEREEFLFLISCLLHSTMPGEDREEEAVRRMTVDES